MILPGRGGLTGGTVIPSRNPLDVLRQDHHAVKRCVIASSLREGKPWLIKPGQRMLFSLGRRIVYERETRTRKPTTKPDALSQWRTMEVQRNYVTLTNEKKKKKNPACAGIFSGSSHTSDFKISTPVATLPGAWHYRVSAGTGRPGVSTL